MEKTWWVYILRCGDGTFYTGVTTDVLARLETHRSGKGAKYTRSRGPLELTRKNAKIKLLPFSANMPLNN